MLFLVVRYGCESWSRKNAEHQRIDASELRCWRRLLRVSLQGNRKGICKRNHKGNQPWIFIGRTDAEAAILGHLIRKANSLENSLMLIEGIANSLIEDKRRKGRPRIRWLDSINNSMDMNLSKLEDGVGQGSLACCSSWNHKELVRHNLAIEQ